MPTYPTYPFSIQARKSYISPKTHKPCSDFAYKVYDIVYTIPKGKITTYKAISNTLNASPRAVGGALRYNPFAPFIPCHRVIASNGYIGGFNGSWGLNQDNCKRKKEILENEGIKFDQRGYIMNEKKDFFYHFERRK